MPKFLRVGPKGAEKPAVLDNDGVLRDLSAVVREIDPETILELPNIHDADIAALPRLAAGERVGAPVGRVGKIVCVGLNYRDHATETGADIPSEPILFLKPPNSIAGPNDTIPYPSGATKLDWECELAVIIGRRACKLTEKAALDAIAGYSIFNDISERAWQLERGGQWVKGKAHDGFGPLGPWLVTPDEIADPQSLDMRLSIDGVVAQDSSTRQMIFPVSFLIAYISQFMTLEPGDVIATGTPAGVGLGHKPPKFLAVDQTIEVEIEGLGRQTCHIGMSH